MRRNIRQALLWVSLGIVLCTSFEGAAGEATSVAAQIKAAYLFNFAKFITWPAKSLATNAPVEFVIGVMGESAFADALQHALVGKSVDNHRIKVRQLSSTDELAGCQIVFIGSSEQARLPQILSKLDDSSVLTVSDINRFLDEGGMVRLFDYENPTTHQKSIRFEVDPERVQRAGLKASSKLLQLSKPPQER